MMRSSRWSVSVAIAALLWHSGALIGAKDSLEQSPETVVVLQNVRVIDGTGAPPRDNQAIVIANGRIRAVGPARDVPVPEGAEVRNLTGRAVLPGLVMLHEHIVYGGGPDRLPFRTMQYSAPRLYLAFGVTTIREAGVGGMVALNLKQAIAAGEVIGPEMFAAGQVISSDNPLNAGHLLRMQAKIARDPDDAARTVRYLVGEGASAIKVHQPISAPILAAVIEEAHKWNVPVIGHLRPVTCLEAARLKIDVIEHGFDGCANDLRMPDGSVTNDPESPPAKELFAALLAANVIMDETPIDDDPLTDEALAVLHPAAREYYLRSRSPEPGASARRNPKNASLAVAFAKAGGRVTVGSDPGGVPRIPGFSNLTSVRLLHEDLGFSTMEAIQIATLNGARALGIDRRTGTIQEGKEADLLVVTGDPLRTLADLAKIELVFSNGRVFSPRALLAEVKGQFGWR